MIKAVPASCLRRYIEVFWCGDCKKSETSYVVCGKKKIVQKCDACGATTPVDCNHKLCTFIAARHKEAMGEKKPQKPMAHALDAAGTGPLVVSQQEEEEKKSKSSPKKERALKRQRRRWLTRKRNFRQRRTRQRISCRTRISWKRLLPHFAGLRMK